MGLSSYEDNKDGTISVTTPDDLQVKLTGNWDSDKKRFDGQVSGDVPGSDIWFDGEFATFAITARPNLGNLCG